MRRILVFAMLAAGVACGELTTSAPADGGADETDATVGNDAAADGTTQDSGSDSGGGDASLDAGHAGDASTCTTVFRDTFDSATGQINATTWDAPTPSGCLGTAAESRGGGYAERFVCQSGSPNVYDYIQSTSANMVPPADVVRVSFTVGIEGATPPGDRIFAVVTNVFGYLQGLAIGYRATDTAIYIGRLDGNSTTSPATNLIDTQQKGAGFHDVVVTLHFSGASLDYSVSVDGQSPHGGSVVRDAAVPANIGLQLGVLRGFGDATTAIDDVLVQTCPP